MAVESDNTPSGRVCFAVRMTDTFFRIRLGKSVADLAYGNAMNHEAEIFERHDSADYVNTIDDVALYLESLIDEGEDDPHVIPQVLGTIARSKNFSEIARQAGMSREGVYKTLSREDNPTLATVIKVAHALGLRLRFEAIA